jgi:hypothetical protein
MIEMNDFRMMIFIEEYIGDALKKGRSEKFCIKKLNDYNKQVRECKASSLFNKEWLNDSFGMEV